MDNPNGKVKPKILRNIIFCSASMLIGVMAGAVLQKYLGFGNIVRSAGIPYPTTAAPTSLPDPEVPESYHGKMQLFILAGQSNMVGWAPIPSDAKTDPRIYMFGADYHWRIAKDPIADPHNQVDKVSENRIAGFGPSMPFALASLERHPELVIGLIPCAKNSSAIIEWQRDLSDKTLYGACLKRILAASPMGQVSGVLFFQGETDAGDPIQFPDPEPHSREWAQLFSAFVTDLRMDLENPELPVVFAQIGMNSSPEAFPNWLMVKEQQLAVDFPMTTMIITDDLPLMDGLHFTTDSYRKIGERFADGYWALIESMPVQ